MVTLFKQISSTLSAESFQTYKIFTAQLQHKVMTNLASVAFSFSPIAAKNRAQKRNLGHETKKFFSQNSTPCQKVRSEFF